MEIRDIDLRRGFASPDAPAIVVTLGDPRGIGPEVMVEAALSLSPELRAFLLLLGPADFNHDSVRSAVEAGLNYEGIAKWDGSERSAGEVCARALEEAVRKARVGDTLAIVTGPVHKPALHAAGRSFPGQTEMLASLTATSVVGMLMDAEETRLGRPLRVLLATTHMPLREVPDRMSEELLVEQAHLLVRSLRDGWKIEDPRLALCGLNPHASDGGLFGNEEATIFAPAVARMVEEGISIAGPLPADTVFGRALAGEFDAVIAPYHDVGMSAFKTVSFGKGVNVTLGLPFVRTSPDHGTAFDIAGKNRADPSSAREAIRVAAMIAAGVSRDSRNRFDTAVSRM